MDWFKNLFFENEDEKIKAELETLELPAETSQIKHDYSFRIFDLKNRDGLNNVTSFIVQDKTLALIKMNKFTGDGEQFKEILNELKNTCDTCNSKVVGINNNTFLVAKNSIEILK